MAERHLRAVRHLAKSTGKSHAEIVRDLQAALPLPTALALRRAAAIEDERAAAAKLVSPEDRAVVARYRELQARNPVQAAYYVSHHQGTFRRVSAAGLFSDTQDSDTDPPPPKAA